NNSVNVTADDPAHGHRRTYERFDLTACHPVIPSSAVIQAATLRLYGTNLPPACRTQDIFRVPSAWTETGITWNNQPFGTSLNNPATAQRTSSIAIGPAGCQNSTVNGYVSGWNVTADVQAFVAGAGNFGWMIRDDAENYASSQISAYATREKSSSSIDDSPQLVMSYR